VSGLLYAFAYDPHPPFGASPTPFIVLMIMGFVIGVFGHIVRAKGLVALGIGMVFLATFLLPLVTNVLKSQQ
jgi:F0F1-type ATP synthase assembly protein I